VLLVVFDLAPAVGAVVGDDVLGHRGEGRCVDRLAPAEGDGPSGCAVVAAGDDSLRVGHERAVVRNTLTWRVMQNPETSSAITSLTCDDTNS
jgi:hypothetical protein